MKQLLRDVVSKSRSENSSGVLYHILQLLFVHIIHVMGIFYYKQVNNYNFCAKRSWCCFAKLVFVAVGFVFIVFRFVRVTQKFQATSLHLYIYAFELL